MTRTSSTLLDRLRQPGPADDAWERFMQLYAPILLRWAELQGFHDADAEDLAQMVLVKLIRLIPSYQRQDGQTFRGWLFTICRNECRDFRSRRATRQLPGSAGLLAVAEQAPIDELDEAQYRRELVRRTLELVRPDFSEQTWEAFNRFVLLGEPAIKVAEKLNISANAVYLARNRVLTRLREELADFLS